MASGPGSSGGRVRLLVAVVVGAGLLCLTALLGSIVVAAMTATGAIATGVSLWVLLGLLTVVLGTGTVAAGGTALLAWLALGQLRTTVITGWRRFLWTSYRRARAVEERSHLGRLVRPTRFFEAKGGHEGHLVEELKARYVAGEIGDVDFERELGRLLGGGPDAGREVRREIEMPAADGGAGQDDSAESDESTRPSNHSDEPRERDEADREREADTK